MTKKRLQFNFILLFVLILSLSVGSVPTEADSGGHFLVPELPSGSSITVDCSDGEWPMDALSFDIKSFTNPLTNLGSGKLVISHPADLMQDEELYVYIQITDNVFSANDQVVLMFDNSHDHAAPNTSSYGASDDRGVRFQRNDTVDRVFGLPQNPSFHASFDAGRECVNDSGGTWEMEAQILPSDLGINGFSSLAGVVAFSQNPDSGSDPIGVWPDTFMTSDPSTWSNVVTRPPIDYILLIDQSGSMSGDKWDSANQAGDNFALILSKLKDDDLDTEYPLMNPSTPGDRLGLATFTWTGGADASASVIALTSIPTNPSSYISGALPPAPGGATPIIGGINETFQMFGGAGNLSNPPPRTRVVMLLSDGKHNSPNSNLVLSLAGGFDYVPNPCGDNSLVRINTVAVGTDATVDTDKLDNIKDCFEGTTFMDPGGTMTNIYNIAGLPGFTGAQLTAQLTKYFVETVEPYYRWNIINETGANFNIQAGNRKLLLFAFWDNPGSAVALTVNSPTGGETGVADTTLGYSYLLLDGPPGGSYTDFQAAGASYKVVIVDPRIEARFGVDNQPHGTSSTITLRARLREDGEPILGADVRVDVNRPDEGFGTFVSTHELKTCEERPPELPPLDSLQGRLINTVDPGITITRDLLASSNRRQQAPDTPAPRFLLMEHLLDICGRKDLMRVDDSGLRLYDDASNGDEVADDGFYTLRFENTEIEGSYVFRFRAIGATTDGLAFSRVREVGDYVRIDVDPGNTLIGSRLVQQVNNFVLREYYVLPRDLTGEYLGPGYAHEVQFIASDGQWVSDVQDYYNGYYTRLLRYDEAKGEPEVTIVVRDVPIEPAGPPIQLPWWVCLLLMLIILILLVLLILCWLRKRRGRKAAA